MRIILQIETTFVVKALKNVQAVCTKRFFQSRFVFLLINLNSLIQVRFNNKSPNFHKKTKTA